MKHLLTYENFMPKRQEDRAGNAEKLGLLIIPKLPLLNIQPFGECNWIYRRSEDYCAIGLWDVKYQTMHCRLKVTMSSNSNIRHLEFETGRNHPVNVIKFADNKQAEEVFDYLAKRWYSEPFKSHLLDHKFSEEEIKSKTKDVIKDAKKLKLQMLDLAKNQNLIL